VISPRGGEIASDFAPGGARSRGGEIAVTPALDWDFETLSENPLVTGPRARH